MSGFDAAWLALREPADRRARADDLLAPLAAAMESRRSADGVLRIVDLACGTGANLRHLAPLLPAAQSWELVDHDERLLAEAGRRSATSTAAAAATRSAAHESAAAATRTASRDPAAATPRIALRHVDLATRLDALALDGAALVTASALLDLVSARWLDALAARCAAARVPALFVLSYDGRIECDARDVDDSLVRDLVNRHQLGDKGFGPALGPGAGDHAARAFAAHGARVATARSDWLLGASEGELQRQLLRGWASAAAELDPTLATRIDGWFARRLAHVSAGRSTLRVGHVDVSACWP